MLRQQLISVEYSYVDGSSQMCRAVCWFLSKYLLFSQSFLVCIFTTVLISNLVFNVLTIFCILHEYKFMMDLCEILINIHFQLKGEKWEISHEEVWRLQASPNDSYCFSMAAKLVIQTQRKIELVWCNFFWSKKNPKTHRTVRST